MLIERECGSTFLYNNNFWADFSTTNYDVLIMIFKF